MTKPLVKTTSGSNKPTQNNDRIFSQGVRYKTFVQRNQMIKTFSVVEPQTNHLTKWPSTLKQFFSNSRRIV